MYGCGHMCVNASEGVFFVTALEICVLLAWVTECMSLRMRVCTGLRFLSVFKRIYEHCIFPIAPFRWVIVDKYVL